MPFSLCLTGMTQLRAGRVGSVSSIVSVSIESKRQMKFTFALNFPHKRRRKRNVTYAKWKVLLSELFRNKNLDSDRRGLLRISYLRRIRRAQKVLSLNNIS